MRRRDEWRRVLARWRRSRMNLREFAAAEGVKWRTLQHWKYVLGKEAAGDGSTASGSGSELSFLELRPARMAGDGCFEVEVGSGCRVRVPPSFEAEALQRLLGILEARS